MNTAHLIFIVELAYPSQSQITDFMEISRAHNWSVTQLSKGIARFKVHLSVSSVTRRAAIPSGAQELLDRTAGRTPLTLIESIIDDPDVRSRAPMQFKRRRSRRLRHLGTKYDPNYVYWANYGDVTSDGKSFATNHDRSLSFKYRQMYAQSAESNVSHPLELEVNYGNRIGSSPESKSSFALPVSMVASLGAGFFFGATGSMSIRAGILLFLIILMRVSYQPIYRAKDWFPYRPKWTRTLASIFASVVMICAYAFFGFAMSAAEGSPLLEPITWIAACILLGGIFGMLVLGNINWVRSNFIPIVGIVVGGAVVVPWYSQVLWAIVAEHIGVPPAELEMNILMTAFMGLAPLAAYSSALLLTIFMSGALYMTRIFGNSEITPISVATLASATIFIIFSPLIHDQIVYEFDQQVDENVGNQEDIYFLGMRLDRVCVKVQDSAAPSSLVSPENYSHPDSISQLNGPVYMIPSKNDHQWFTSVNERLELSTAFSVDVSKLTTTRADENGSCAK